MFKINSPKRALVVAAITIVGVAAVISSFAATPPPGTTSEQKVPITKLSEFSPLDSSVIDNSKKVQFDGAYKFQFNVPSNWQIYKFNGDDSAYLILHARSPDADLEEISTEGGYEVAKGAIIEASIFQNTKYKDTADYMSHLGSLAINTRNLTVAGVPAAQYEIAEEEAEEAVPKIITSFVAKGKLFVISYIYSKENYNESYTQVFNNSLESIAIGD